MKSRMSLFVISMAAIITVSAYCQIAGDANNNGTVDIIDALVVAQYYVGLNPSITLALADANCDGSVTITDALRIAQFYVGLAQGIAPCTTAIPSTLPTPTVVPTPIGDAYIIYGSTITAVELESAAVGRGSIPVETEIPGYTGTGYIRMTSAPASVLFWLEIPSGEYTVGMRIYDNDSGEWIWTGADIPRPPVAVPYSATFNSSSIHWVVTLSMQESYTIDRVVVYQVGTPLSEWQDLSLAMRYAFTATPSSTRTTFRITASAQ